MLGGGGDSFLMEKFVVKKNWSVLIFDQKCENLTCSMIFQTIVRKEIKQYSFTHLFADFCGYVGLFLGESLISYFLQAIHWIRREFGKKEKEIKLEPREELQNDFVRNLFIRRNQDKMKTSAIKNVKKT